MYSKLETYISDLVTDYGSISEDRKKELNEVAHYIRFKLLAGEPAKLNFICTHNSRRSHLAQIWTQTAAAYYDIEGIATYSGGTESTAFNPRAVAAVERAGFNVQDPGGENPMYKVLYSDEAEPMICFSKTFDDAVNPDNYFAAIMTCSDADENCPNVPGAEFRKAITYVDPKEADGTDSEEEVYDERCRQIGTEMFYMMNEV